MDGSPLISALVTRMWPKPVGEVVKITRVSDGNVGISFNNTKYIMQNHLIKIQRVNELQEDPNENEKIQTGNFFCSRFRLRFEFEMLVFFRGCAILLVLCYSWVLIMLVLSIRKF